MKTINRERQNLVRQNSWQRRSMQGYILTYITSFRWTKSFDSSMFSRKRGPYFLGERVRGDLNFWVFR